MTGTLYGSKVLYGSNVLCHALPYSESTYKLGAVADVAVSITAQAFLSETDAALAVCAGKINTESDVALLTAARVGTSTAVGVETQYRALTESDVALHVELGIHIVADVTIEISAFANSVADLQILINEILKTLYALLPEHITDIEFTPVLIAELAYWPEYDTAPSACLGIVAEKVLTQNYITETEFTQEYITTHDPYIHYATESEVH